MDRFAQFWWLQIPIRLQRGSRVLSEAWFDGAYLTAWPAIAGIAPFMVFLFGLFEGATHWSTATFSGGRVSPQFHAVDFAQMLPLLGVAVVLGVLSSQLGLLLVIGYAAGDLFIAPAAFSARPSAGWELTHLYAPQLISYYVFALLAVTPTLTAKAMAATLPAWLRKPGALFLTAGSLTACLAVGASVYAWTVAAPMIVRVQWLWPGGTPPIAVTEYVLKLNPWLPITAVVAMALRLGLSALARGNGPQAALIGALREMAALDAGRTPIPAGQVLQAIGVAFLTTITICGLFDSVLRAAWVFLVVLGLLLVWNVVLPKIAAWRWWGQFANKVPLLLRSVATILIALVLTRSILSGQSLSPRANPVPGAFGAEIFCFLLSMAVTLVLLPPAFSGAPARLSPTVRRSGRLAVLLCMFVVAIRPAYAGICLDPFCCFNGDTLMAALAIAALLLLALPGLLALAGIADLGIAGALLLDGLASTGEALFEAILTTAPESLEASLTRMEGEAVLSEEKMIEGFQKTLDEGGERALQKSYQSILENLEEHEQKLIAYEAANGYTSSVAREIDVFKRQLQVLRKIFNL